MAERAGRRRFQVVATTGTGDVDRLLGLVAHGDSVAFEQLFRQLADDVYGVTRRVVRDPALAQDAAQETMVEVWRLAPRFDAARGGGRSWVLSIAHRRAVDRVRREQSARGRAERASTIVEVVQSEDAATPVVDDDDRLAVERSLEGLTSRQREAVELAYYGGLTHLEIAELLEVPLGTVKTRIRDGLIKLRDDFVVQGRFE